MKTRYVIVDMDGGMLSKINESCTTWTLYKKKALLFKKKGLAEFVSQKLGYAECSVLKMKIHKKKYDIEGM
jgi:hypothetical protein